MSPGIWLEFTAFTCFSFFSLPAAPGHRIRPRLLGPPHSPATSDVSGELALSSSAGSACLTSARSASGGCSLEGQLLLKLLASGWPAVQMQAVLWAACLTLQDGLQQARCVRLGSGGGSGPH